LKAADGLAPSSEYCWATRVLNPHCIHRPRAAALAPLMRTFVADHPLPISGAADPSELALAQLVAASKPRAAALAAAAARRGGNQRAAAAAAAKSSASSRGGKQHGKSKQRGDSDDDDDDSSDGAGGNHNDDDDDDEDADENDYDDDDDEEDIPFEQQQEQTVAGDDLDCEMCGRVMPLTRHHLIPKSTHARYTRLGIRFGAQTSERGDNTRQQFAH
jgi:hypothetical protein